ncbi:MAG: DUF4194 domain-containing protein [Deltaproteobacteria bacterium]|nr:DUF4194 domain-containing protein [Deltaproteobacteria bacterium]
MIELSHVVVALMKGVTHRESDEPLWQALLDHQAKVREYVSVMGLELLLDEAEGYAYLRQRPQDEGAGLPRLVSRRPLSYPVSLLLALLRKRLAEFDARSGEVRLVLRRDEIADTVRIFMPDSGNEVRQLDRIDAHIKKVVELGFLRPLRGNDDQFEVLRILKAFVDAQWLHDFDERLADYRKHAAQEAAS